jgi:tetratricopeptide (TPR) repeat protein
MLTSNKILAYVKGELNHAESFEVEEHLLKDEKSWATAQTLMELQEQGELDNVTNELEKRFKASLKQSETPEIKKTATVRKIQPFYQKMIFRIAAVVLILAAPLIYLVTDPGGNDGDILSQYFTPPELVSTTFVRGGTDKNLLGKVQRAYIAGDFESAAKMFEPILIQFPEDAIYQFYAGICFLKSEQATKAIAAFNWIIEDKNSAYAENAMWFLALAYFQNEMLSEGCRTLDHVKPDGNDYVAEAKKLSAEICENVK